MVLINNHTSFTKRFCKVDTSDSCKEVFGTPFSRLSNKIHLADIGIMYYSSLSIYVLFVSLFEPTYKLVAPIVLLTICTFLFTLIGAGYQKFILKKWCRLCMLLYLVIWLQTAVIMYILYASIDVQYQPAAFDFFLRSDFYPNVFALLFAGVLSLYWLFVKPSIVNASKNSFLYKQVVKAKRDINLFIANLQLQQRATVYKGEIDYILGNSKSEISLILVLSPFCKACSIEYSVIASLLKLYPDKLSIHIRFVVDPSNNKVKEAVSLIYNRYIVTNERDKVDILLHWFSGSDIFSIVQGNRNDDLGNINGVVDFIKANNLWFKENGVDRTPTLFIQGYKKPDFYSVHDIVYFCKLNIDDPVLFKRITTINT